MSKIIIATGKAQSGKSITCDYIKSILSNYGYSSHIYAFADPLKDLCVGLFGLKKEQCWGNKRQKDETTEFAWENLPVGKNRLRELMDRASIGSKSISQKTKMTAREIMQVWGTDIFREFSGNCWVNSTVNRIKEGFFDYALICDARFPNELDVFKTYDPLVIQLTREIQKSSHPSESGLNNYNWDSFKNYNIVDNKEMAILEQNSFIRSIVEKFIENNDNRSSTEQTRGLLQR